MPQIAVFFVRNILIGFVVAGVFVALMIAVDVNGLRSALAGEERLNLALFVLWLGNGFVFGAIQVAWAVLRMAEK